VQAKQHSCPELWIRGFWIFDTAGVVKTTGKGLTSAAFGLLSKKEMGPNLFVFPIFGWQFVGL